MWGIDIELADELSGDLRRWAAELRDVHDQIRLAETLVALDSGVRTEIAALADGFSDTAVVLDVGSERLLNTPAVQAVAVSQLVAVRNQLLAAPRRPSLPDANLDALLAAMVRGDDPSRSPLGAELFPATYRDWHRERNNKRLEIDGRWPDVTDPEMRRHLSAGAWAQWHDHQSQLVPGVDAAGQMDRDAALLLLSHQLGPAASPWLGRQLASLVSDWNNGLDERLLAHATADSDAMLAFFNALGADGVALIPQRLHGADRADLIPGFAAALARASQTGQLEFTGTELAGAGVRPAWRVEQLLSADGFEAEFLLGAVLTYTAQVGLHLPDRQDVYEAVVRNDLSGELLARMDDHQIARVFWAAPLTSDDEALAALLVQASSNGRAVDAVVSHLDAMEPGAVLPIGVADAVSLMLAEVLELSPPLEPGRQAEFLSALDVVVGSGSGAAMFGASSALLRTTIEDQTAQIPGPLAYDLDREANLVGAVMAVLLDGQIRGAVDFDQSRARLKNLLSGGTGVGGLAVGSWALLTPAVAGLGIAGLLFTFGGMGVGLVNDGEERVGVLSAWLARSTGSDAAANYDIVAGLVRSGRVQLGISPVQLVEPNDGAAPYLVVPLGDGTLVVHVFETDGLLASDFSQFTVHFDGPQGINVESMAELIAQLNEFDHIISDHLHEAHDQLVSEGLLSGPG